MCIVAFDSSGRATSIEEKPQRRSPDWAVTGLYFFDNEVCDMQPKSSLARGELEITDVNTRY